VPEKLAAALDMTAELPHVVRRTSATPPPPAAESRPRLGDETMELPIFRELESAWFRTRRSAPEVYPARPRQAGPGADAPRGETVAPVDATRGPSPAAQHDPTVVTGSSAMASNPTGGWPERSVPTPTGGAAGPTGPAPRRQEPVITDWTTAADEGWRAASAAAENEPTDTTNAGLPKRVPMAQLVPGGVDKPTVPVQRRTPESVRGLLSAYHRGVQRGRGNKDDNTTSPGTPPGASQGRPAPEADNGQKEQK
jgi:hypothetical protein